MDVTHRNIARPIGRRLSPLVGACIAAVVPLTAGCVVPQPSGDGRLLHKVEPKTQRGYLLYLPDDYLRHEHPTLERRWPVVVTFHGMKPFDNAGAQANEWQYEADNYGLIVVAPQLLTSDLLMEFPLRTVHKHLKDDERATVAILEQVFRTTDADPTRVLATSWSSGGYVAHYMLNRHPKLFSCIAPRQSNFSAAVLEPRHVRLYRDTPVGIFFGENDFAVCRKESTEAVHFYRRHGFKTVHARIVRGLGHERTPQTAAAFFAENSVPPIQPIRPAQAQAALARLEFRPATFAEQTSADRATAAPTAAADRRARPTVAARQRTARPEPVRPPVLTPSAGPISISISTKVGIVPLRISFAVQLPEKIRRGAICSWTDNGRPICTGFSGHKILTTPGEHVISVLVMATDNREYRPGPR